MAHSDLQDMKNALARALGGPGSGEGVPLIAPLWREAVGPLAAHCRPVSLARGVLRVEAAQDFAFDLGRQRDLVVARLNARLGRGAVKVIEFVAPR
jgi:hypothetical protein